jgi:hypothetical protein
MGIKEWLFGKKNGDARRGTQDINKPIRYQFSKGVIYGPFELYCGDTINLGVPDEIFYGLDDPYNLLSLSGTLIFYNKKIRTCEGQWYIHYNYEGIRYRNKIILRRVEGGLIRFVPRELQNGALSDSLSRLK